MFHFDREKRFPKEMRMILFEKEIISRPLLDENRSESFIRERAHGL